MTIQDEIASAPLLEPAHERWLLEQIDPPFKITDPRTPHQIACQKELALGCVRFVWAMARAYASGPGKKCFQVDDLAQVGVFGLYHAMRNYDLERGTRFLTFARSHISAAILKEINNSGVVHAPMSCRFQGKRVVHPEVFSLHDRRAYKVPLREGIPVKRKAPIREVSEQKSEVAKQNGRVAHEQRAEVVQVAIERYLDDRQRLIIRMRFFDDPRKTLSEAGEVLGISRERVRQIETIALKRLLASPLSDELRSLVV